MFSELPSPTEADEVLVMKMVRSGLKAWIVGGPQSRWGVGKVCVLNPSVQQLKLLDSLVDLPPLRQEEEEGLLLLFTLRFNLVKKHSRTLTRSTKENQVVGFGSDSLVDWR